MVDIKNPSESQLSESERHRLSAARNGTHRDACIHQMFEQWVDKNPDAIAVKFEDQHLTYRELNARANQLAHYLKMLGVGRDVLVGLCMERSVELMIGIL